MQFYTNNITNPAGTALAGLSVRVQHTDGSDAPIYSDNGVMPSTNPLTTDGTGSFGFYAANGRYQLAISGNGITPYTVRDILLHDPTQPFTNDIDMANLASTANGSGADLIANAAKKVASIAALRALRVPQGSDAQTVIVDGVGTYVFSPTNVGADNSGTTLQPSTSPSMGRWIKIVEGGSYNVAWFGAKGDGVTDDSIAIQAAINSLTAGGTVFLPAKHSVTFGITVSSAVRLLGAGPGATTIIPSGSFDLFTFNGGGMGSGMSDIGISAANMTGGNVVVVNGQDRTLFKNIIVTNPFNGFYVTKANVCSLSTIWVNNVRGAYGIQWYGSATARSDVLDIDNVVISSSVNTIGATGILVDGNVNTLDIRHVACTNMGRGLWVKNSSGGPNAAFITGYDFQTDYPLYEGIRIEGSARSVFLTDIYVHSSAQADGVYIDPSVQNVSIKGGQIDSNYQRGIFAGGRYIRLSALNVSTNSKAGSALWPGIEIGGSSIGVNLSGSLSGQWVGYASENQSYGVVIDAGAQAYAVTGCNLRNNVTGDYLDNANDSTSLIFGNNTATSTPAKVDSPIQSMTGDMPINGCPGYSVKLGTAGNGTAFSAQAADANTVNFVKAFGHAAGGNPAIQSVGADTNLNLVLLAKGTGGVVSQANFLPTSDNAFTNGNSGFRWAAVWSATGTIQTSDERTKTEIKDSALGLSFINSLRPVSYKFKVGGNEIVRQVYFDKDGNEIPGGQPIPEDAIPGPVITKEKPGNRTHGGLIAQEVKAAADAAGVDFGGWILTDKDNPDSPQGVRYDQLISPLIKAVQELSVKVAALESK